MKSVAEEQKEPEAVPKNKQDIGEEEKRTEPYLEEMEQQCQAAGEQIQGLLNHLEPVIQGKRDVLQKVLVCLLSGGHLLLEDLPGVGKTTLAKALARALGGESDTESEGFRYGRIQFTPDLLPYDVTGVEVWRPDRHCFEFHPGPVFCNLLLADEINRATPKVQSALLEVMAEQQVTVGQQSHNLQSPFWVIATQNPIEMAGTYLLPKAQLDRFSMKLSLGYPGREYELSIVRSDPSHRRLPQLAPFIGPAQILALQGLVQTVYCAPGLEAWAVEVVRKTRKANAVRLGVSTRGLLMWLCCARAYALCQGRSYVIDADLLALAHDVLCHRLELRDAHEAPNDLLEQILGEECKNLP